MDVTIITLNRRENSDIRWILSSINTAYLDSFFIFTYFYIYALYYSLPVSVIGSVAVARVPPSVCICEIVSAGKDGVSDQ